MASSSTAIALRPASLTSPRSPIPTAVNVCIATTKRPRLVVPICLALTGITDENGARFATFSYDSFGRTTQTVHDAGGSNANRYQLTYNASAVQTTVTDPLGTVRTFGFQTTVGVVKNTAQTQPGGGGSGAAANATTYDVNGNIASRTDFNG